MKRISLSLIMLCLLTQVYADIIQTSTTLPQDGKPEYLYSMKDGSGHYATQMTSPVIETDTEIGLFAFYPVDGVEDAFYIYSYNAKKWLTYEKAENYSNSSGFVKLSDTQVADSYFRLNNYVEENYDISPYTTDGTVAEIYLNWYKGCADNIGISLGLWENGGNDDVGSAFTFYEYQFAYKAPEWNDYPIFFTNAIDGWSTGEDTASSKETWVAFSGDNNSSLKAVVDVDTHSTISFDLKTSFRARLELYIGGSPEWLIGTVVYYSQRVTYYHRQLQQSIPHFTVFSRAGSPFLVGPDKSQEPGKMWKSRHLQVPACCLTKNSYRSIR